MLRFSRTRRSTRHRPVASLSLKASARPPLPAAPPMPGVPSSGARHAGPRRRRFRPGAPLPRPPPAREKHRVLPVTGRAASRRPQADASPRAGCRGPLRQHPGVLPTPAARTARPGRLRPVSTVCGQRLPHRSHPLRRAQHRPTTSLRHRRRPVHVVVATTSLGPTCGRPAQASAARSAPPSLVGFPGGALALRPGIKRCWWRQRCTDPRSAHDPDRFGDD